MSTFLTAEWRKLIMAQYEVSPGTLAPWLPTGVELDLYQGRCYVSLVGFVFDKVRLKRIAIPFHTRFEEINLRFYVIRTDPDGVRRRGVVFIREFVPRHAITLIANKLYEEPYATLPTRHTFTHNLQSLHISYSWKHHHTWQQLAVEADPKPQPIASDSVEEFITEHYWGFTRRSNGSTSQYEVRHPRWNVYPIRSHIIQTGFGALYGPAFAHIEATKPANILLAEGSAISVATNSPIR